MTKMESVEHQLVQEKERLSWDAVHDPLTNVYNRRWLMNYFSTMNRYDFAVHSLIYIDLDNFKQINDRYSHDAGDKYLQETVHQISKCIRSNDHIARLGGDEFCVYLGNCNKEKAQFIAECILRNVADFQIECNEHIVKSNGCSIGLTSFTSEISEFEEVLKQADQAAIKAKQSGKNRIEWYNDE
jgi:diguanylate cyclase (GGDEF)-like protein